MRTSVIGELMGRFENIANLIRDSRLELDISQTVVSDTLGYKNCQVISNIERGLCSVPIQKISAFSDALQIDQNKIINALLLDYRNHLLAQARNQEVQTRPKRVVRPSKVLPATELLQ